MPELTAQDILSFALPLFVAGALYPGLGVIFGKLVQTFARVIEGV